MRNEHYEMKEIKLITLSICANEKKREIKNFDFEWAL